MFEIPNYDPRDKINRFEFKAPRRRFWHFRSVFSIPLLQYVPLETMRKARSTDAPLQLAEVARVIGEPAAARAIMRLNQPEIKALERAWLEASAVGLGESAASST